MSVILLDKIRRMNKLLHDSASNVFVFDDICQALGETLESNILVLSRKGKILGRGGSGTLEDDERWQSAVNGTIIDKTLNTRLLNILSTQENVHLGLLGFEEENSRDYNVTVTPIYMASERLGTFFIYRKSKPYDIDDIILAEYGTAVIGLEMLRSLSEENMDEIRRRQVVLAAINTLSDSEIEAVRYILAELSGKEGILVASKIADRVGITRSVIVNALRKLESAGVIESRSSGMKGTYIKIVNDIILTEIGTLSEE